MVSKNVRKNEVEKWWRMDILFLLLLLLLLQACVVPRSAPIPTTGD
jgi:hypothetical protein